MQLTSTTVVHNLPVIMQITFAFTLIYIWCLAALKMSQLAVSYTHLTLPTKRIV